MSEYEKAWAHYQTLQHIKAPNEQNFRHGWNAALRISSRICDDLGEMFGSPARHCGSEIAKLEVEVKT